MDHKKRTLDDRDDLIEFSDHCCLMERNNKKCPPIPRWIDKTLSQFESGPLDLRRRKTVVKLDQDSSSVDERMAQMLRGLKNRS